MEAALDRMESQLLFGNAIMGSAVGELRPKNKKKDGAKKEKGTLSFVV